MVSERKASDFSNIALGGPKVDSYIYRQLTNWKTLVPLDCKEITPVNPKGSEVRVAQSCPTLCEPMDYTGILQARILEWVAIPV